jgi:hypothetical protein
MTQRLLPRLWHIAQSPMAYRMSLLLYAKDAQTMARTANIHHLVFCANCHKITDPFVVALAVRTMVEQPSHIAASTDTESQQNLPDLETWFLHRWMHYCRDLSLETVNF